MTITAWESIIIILEKSFFEYPPTAGGENQPSSWEPTQEGGGDTHTCGLPSGQQEDEEREVRWLSPELREKSSISSELGRHREGDGAGPELRDPSREEGSGPEIVLREHSPPGSLC